MDDRLYKTLKMVAISLGLAWVGWAVYDNFSGHTPHAIGLETGRKYFKDGDYANALDEFAAIVAADPRQIEAQDGVARSLMQLGRNDEANKVYRRMLALASRRMAMWRPLASSVATCASSRINGRAKAAASSVRASARSSRSSTFSRRFFRVNRGGDCERNMMELKGTRPRGMRRIR